MIETLCTIGYEGADIEAFIATLARHRIRMLIDVRDVPISRKKGFSKSSLRTALAGHDIDYLHLKGLGDPKPGRVAARAGDMLLFQRIFRAHMQTQGAKHDLEIAVKAVTQTAAALMCFEREPCGCHRAIVADKIVHITGQRLHNLSVPGNSARHGTTKESRAA